MKDMKEKALQRAMRLCSRSEKSGKDIKEKLQQWGVPSELHEEIITQLYEQQFLDDKRYANSYVHDKIYLSKWGRQKVFFALKYKNIEEQIITKTIATIDEERYQEGLRHLLEKKAKSISAKNTYEQIAKLIRFGQSRGFTTAEINKALNEIL